MDLQLPQFPGWQLGVKSFRKFAANDEGWMCRACVSQGIEIV